jgi:hypothetical protein
VRIGAIRGGSLDAVRDDLAGFEGSLGSGLTGEVEVELRPFASLGSFLAFKSAAEGRFEEADEVDEEREDLSFVAGIEGDSEPLAASSCLMAATRALLGSSGISSSTDASRLTSGPKSSSADSSLDEFLLRRPISTMTAT